MTAAECEKYAGEFERFTWIREDSWDNQPKGCFRNTKTNKVYFNNHETGAGSSDSPTVPICKPTKGNKFVTKFRETLDQV